MSGNRESNIIVKENEATTSAEALATAKQHQPVAKPNCVIALKPKTNPWHGLLKNSAWLIKRNWT